MKTHKRQRLFRRRKPIIPIMIPIVWRAQETYDDIAHWLAEHPEICAPESAPMPLTRLIDQGVTLSDWDDRARTWRMRTVANHVDQMATVPVSAR